MVALRFDLARHNLGMFVQLLDERADLLSHPNLTLASTRTACLQLAILCPCTIACCTWFGQVENDLLLRTEVDISEGDGMSNENVRTPTCGASTRATAKKRGKEISSKDVLEVDVESTATKTTEGRTLRSTVPKPVVLSPLLVVREHRIGFLDLFESVLRILLGAPVGVVFASETAEGVLEVACRSRLLNAENVVVVSLLTHAPSS